MNESETHSPKKVKGYHTGNVETVISVEEVARQAEQIATEGPTLEKVAELAKNDAFISIENLRAGYGKMEILHDFNLTISKAQSLCLIGPNGAGKSTILHSIYGFTNIFSGKIEMDGNEITKLSPAEKLKSVGIAYILQDNSVFPDMTVEENLLMGGYIKDKTEESYHEAEKIFEKYERLRNRRNQPAKVLSGGERRLLEISRALVMKPSILLVDEPSIGLEPKYIDMVFEILGDLQKNEKTHISIERYKVNTTIGRSITAISLDNGIVTQRLDARGIKWLDSLKIWNVTDFSIREFKLNGEVKEMKLSKGDTLLNLNFVPEDITQQSKTPDEMSFADLTIRIQQLKENGVDTIKWEVDRLFKISFAFTNLIVVLFGLPLVVMKSKGGLSFGAGMGIFVIFIYYAFIKFGMSMGYNGVMSPIVAAWMGNVLFSLGGISLLIFARK